MRRAAADRQLAPTGAGAGAVAIVGVVAGADHRGIAEAPWILPGPAAGADGARDVALAVLGDEVDRAGRAFRIGRKVHQARQISVDAVAEPVLLVGRQRTADTLAVH